MKPGVGLFALVCVAFLLFVALWIFFNIYEPAKAGPRPPESRVHRTKVIHTIQTESAAPGILRRSQNLPFGTELTAG